MKKGEVTTFDDVVDGAKTVAEGAAIAAASLPSATRTQSSHHQIDHSNINRYQIPNMSSDACEFLSWLGVLRREEASRGNTIHEYW